MATLYSNLYTRDTSSASGYGYKGPSCVPLPGQVMAVFGTYTGTFSSDTLKCFKFPAPGCKVLTVGILQSADLDTDSDFTVDIGFTSDIDALVAASTGLQATTAVELDWSDLAAKGVTAINDEFLLTRAAGELEVSGTLRFAVTFIVP
mgnify:CR=1 FL=1